MGQEMVHLGFGTDSTTSGFFLPEEKRVRFRDLHERLLLEGQATLHDVQGFVGRCNSLRLAFPAASLFMHQCCLIMNELTDVSSSMLPAVVVEEITKSLNHLISLNLLLLCLA